MLRHLRTVSLQWVVTANACAAILCTYDTCVPGAGCWSACYIGKAASRQVAVVVIVLAIFCARNSPLATVNAPVPPLTVASPLTDWLTQLVPLYIKSCRWLGC